MSTRIYNGYRISSADGGRPDPFEFLTSVRTQMDAMYRHMYTTTLVRIATAIVDHRRHAPQSPFSAYDIDQAALRGDNAPIWLAQSIIDDAAETVRTQGRRAPGLDFQCEMTLYSDPQDPTGPLYAQLFVELGQYRAVFEALPGVEPYGYWNNTDRADGVTDDEWRQRAQRWDRIRDHRAGCTRGLSWTMLGPADALLPPLVAEELLGCLPDNASRARNLAFAVAHQRRQEQAANEPVDMTADRTDIAATAMEVLREVRAAAKDLNTQMEQLLEPVTLDDLFGNSSAN